MIEKIIQKLNNIFKPQNNRVLIDIPDCDVIDCEIETPQFVGGKISKMYRQRGKFYKSNLMFIHSGLISGHNVSFQSIEGFKKALIHVF